MPILGGVLTCLKIIQYTCCARHKMCVCVWMGGCVYISVYRGAQEVCVDTAGYRDATHPSSFLHVLKSFNIRLYVYSVHTSLHLYIHNFILAYILSN